MKWVTEDGASGTISCDHVVNCAGMWGREVGQMLGVNLPLQACEHFYIVSEPIPGLEPLQLREGVDDDVLVRAQAQPRAGVGQLPARTDPVPEVPLGHRAERRERPGAAEDPGVVTRQVRRVHRGEALVHQSRPVQQLDR